MNWVKNVCLQTSSRDWKVWTPNNRNGVKLIRLTFDRVTAGETKRLGNKALSNKVEKHNATPSLQQSKQKNTFLHQFDQHTHKSKRFK